MQPDQQSILNSLRDKGPEAWRAYLRPFEEGQPLTGLSMLVIFHYAAPLAKDQGSLEWAEVAVRSSELEALRCGGTERENALLWAMKLRSWFIARMGSRPDHLVLDKEIILHWAMKELDIPIQTVKEKAGLIWKDLARIKGSPNPEDMQRVHDDF